VNFVKKICAASLVLAIVSGCAQNPAEYEEMGPALVVEDFFSGPVTAYGLVQDSKGQQLRRFTVDIVGTWEGDKGTLHESFVYDDGEEQVRIWELTNLGDGKYQGVAGDVVGVADGQAIGNALQWDYVLSIPYKDGTIDVSVDDWMYLIDENNMINRSTLKKLGVTVAEVTLYFVKPG